jgi:hypothetical protein
MVSICFGLFADNNRHTQHTHSIHNTLTVHTVHTVHTGRAWLHLLSSRFSFVSPSCLLRVSFVSLLPTPYLVRFSIRWASKNFRMT